MKYLILGAGGQLAKEFIKVLQDNSLQFTALSREELDVTRTDAVIKIITELKPDVVINCSAYNLVDKAEEDPTQCMKVNAFGVANLVFACMQVNAFLVHYSTDYVFDGIKEGLYIEEDRPNPINMYGKSKLFGEIFIKEQLENYLLFRTSWVYGEGKQNFLYKLQQWAQNNEYLRIACDEFSVPTSTRTIVEVTLTALRKGAVGLYHLVNSGYASRYEWAKEYLKLKGIKKFVYPAYQHEFKLPAKRPRWSAMSNDKICKDLGIEMRSWKEELRMLSL